MIKATFRLAFYFLLTHWWIFVSLESEDKCTTSSCVMLAEKLRNSMDISMEPCHNFYEFACGNYKYTTSIPDGYNRISAIEERSDIMLNKAIKFLNVTDSEANSEFLKARNVFHSCMDEKKIEKTGEFSIPISLKLVGLPIKPPFNGIAPKSFNLSRTLAKLHRYHESSFVFTSLVEFDEEHTTKNILYIGKVSENINIILTNRMDNSGVKFSHFSTSQMNLIDTSTSDKFKKINQAMTEFMKFLVKYYLQLTYTKHSKNTYDLIYKRIQQVVTLLMDLENVFRETHPEEDKKKYTVNELQEITDKLLINSDIKMDWLKYIVTLFEDVLSVEELFQGGMEIYVQNINQLKQVFRTLSGYNNSVIQSTLWFIVVQENIGFGTEELRKYAKNYFKELNITLFESRERRCAQYVMNQLGFTIAHHLLTNDPQVFKHRSELIEMLNNLVNVFVESVTNSDWLDNSTKMATLSKIRSFMGFISFPDWLLDVNNLEIVNKIKPDFGDLSYFKFVMKYNDVSKIYKLQTLLKENDLSNKGFDNPSITNACYYFYFNAIDIPFASVGYPLFAHDLRVLNYAYLGFILAHEITHSLDKKGIKYDSWGNRTKWWKKRTMKKYEEKSQCFVNSYNNIYLEEIDKYVNGELTLSENMADNGGFRQSLKAYINYVSNNGKESKLISFENYSHEQLFTLAYANLWCENSRPEFAQWVVKNDVHSPNAARVLGVMMNSEEFSEIWKCKSTDKMNPKDKCVIW